MERFRDFISRYRRKLLIAGLVMGGSFLAIKYAQRKLIEFQEKQAREFFEKQRRLQHFDSTERTCNEAIIQMSDELMQAIIKQCNTDDLLKQLRENPPNKLELWEEIKIVSFTRLTAFIYAASMLTVALRIQLNVLGGYIYCGTTTTTTAYTSTQKFIISNEIKEYYLTLIKYFIDDGGLAELIQLIRTKVISVMKSISLTKNLSLADMEQLFWSLQMCINSDTKNDPCSKMFKYVLPSQVRDCTKDNDILLKMFNETLDLLESEDTASVCSNNICRGFSLAVDMIAEKLSDTMLTTPNSCSTPSSLANKSTKFTDDNNIIKTNVNDANTIAEETDNNHSNSACTTSTTSDNLLNINNVQIPLAKIIPIVCGLTSKGFDSKARHQNLATSLITYYVMSEKCKILAANIYETFSLALS